VLQVVKPRGTLDVCERMRWRIAQLPEHLPAAQHPLELPHELLQMMLHDAVQVNQTIINIIWDFYLGGRPHETNAAAPANTST
jgi:hypothetical protein